jgi:aminopeptidase N
MMKSRFERGWSLIAALAFAAGCGGGEGGGTTTGTPVEQTVPPKEDLGRDILHTKLEVDLATKTGKATIDLAPSMDTGASFEAGGLEIKSVTSEDKPLEWSLFQGQLDLGVAVKPIQPTRVEIEYGFAEKPAFQGLMAQGSTLVWPYYCGNLFPCHSNPADGTTFELAVAGAPAGQTSIHPTGIPGGAPSYQIAWATGDYASIDLGTTVYGTHLTAYYLPGGLEAAQKGTAQLKAVMDWYELTYAQYPYSPEAGVVAVEWGAGAYGGMEHHPLWHVSTIAMGDPWIQAHEAAHGWFGGGVRIACWEDLVLSEGTVSYLEARSITAVMGAVEGQKLWDHYKSRLDLAMAGTASKIAWPEGCGQIDVLTDLFSDIVYMKGAFFFRALESKISESVLDTALKAFYVKYKHKSATFANLLEIVKAQSGYDATACAESWLKSEAVPAEVACP